MKVFAISDLHLSTTEDKPMEIFGGAWENYFEKIRESWLSQVGAEDVVLIAGDISWAMTLENALKDIACFADLPGKKILIRGNHDYWWHSLSRIRDALPENVFVLQNDAMKIGNFVFTGTRGWSVEGTPGFSEEDKKLVNRETERWKLCLRAANALKEEGDTIIALSHFPPFNVRRENSPFTELMESGGVSKVVYGHLHGKDVRADLQIQKNGVTYYLTSCDLVGNRLIRII